MKTPRMEMQTPCGAFFVGGDLWADARIGPYRSEIFRLQRRKRLWADSISARRLSPYLWYFIPALIVQAR